MSTFDPTKEQFYPVSAVAQMFHVKALTIREWIESGKIKAVKPARAWLIPHSEIVRVANLKYGSTDDKG